MAVSTQGIQISGIHLLNPPISWKGDPQLEIKVKFISKAATDTQSAVGISDQDNNRMIWKEPFIFTGDITDDTLLTFTVRRKRVIQKNITVVSCEHRVTDLLEQQGDSGPCKLDVGGECELTLHIKKLSELDVVSELVKQAPAGLGSLWNLNVPAQIATVIDSGEKVYNDNVKTWVSFIDTFHAFMKVMDRVSKISVYVQVAWSLLSIIPKTIIAKKNCDDKVKELCEKLKDIYEYIMDGERLRELAETQSRDRPATHWSTILSTLVQQTIECAYFLRAYGMENTAKNIVKAIGWDTNVKTQAFIDKLDHLMKVMTDSVILETGIVTLRISGEIAEHRELTLLGEMPYDSGAGYFPNKECLPGTRQRLINDIFEWLNNDSSTQILVLNGQAGIGKSAVAHTIAKMLKQHNRLGSMFCFNRSYADRRNRLFSTISRNLADGDITWRKELVKIIGNNSDVRKKEDVRTQFNELIIKPSQNMATNIGPVVIVVDALDESGDREERREILGILLNEWSKLPKNYRMFVTTRPEQDIEDQCEKFDISRKRMGDVDAEETCRDIEAFVSDRLGSISLTLDSIDGNWRNILAKRAEGLFQWAQTACRFIDPTIPRSQLIKKKWKTCISNSSSSLYGLYRQIILNQSEAKDDDFVEDFKTIVGAIMTAREPLSINALQNIFRDIEDIESILTPFGSFFVGVHNQLTPVRPVHTSLFDFFISKKSAEEYYIDTSDQSRMTFGCLKVMDRMLCFNICQLETSHRRNEEVPNFSARVEDVIPFHLSYSCRFWALHLRFSSVEKEIVFEIRRLMDNSLMYYFEVLGLLYAVDQGCVAMREIADWCKDTDSDLAADATDAWKFGVDFGGIMTESTPHLYLSALPFAPCDSFVSKRYLKRYPELFTFEIGQPVSSSRTIGLTQTLPYPKIAFSSKDRYIAAASGATGEFLLWNYITGEHLAHLKTGRDHHASGVSDIVYSLDGELVYCCFSGGDILVWNTETKETRIERYEGIVDNECHHCTISSDGCFIIRVTIEGAIFVLERKSRQIVEVFENRYYFSAISPNGQWIAFNRCEEDDVYIWNTRCQTQHCVMPCYSTGRDLALTDSYIAFPKDDETIEIRDLRINTKLTEIRHGKYITSLCLSPDDQYFLVTSGRLYSIWSVSTGDLITRSYEDEVIDCLGFSHDSKSIALYTIDGTLRVQQWDKSIESNHLHSNEIGSVYAGWLRGSYLILWYKTILDKNYLQISDITTTNTVIFDTELKDNGPVEVSPDEENVRVAYGNSRGLCLWDDKEGEIVVNVDDGPANSITALVYLDNYLISAHERTIKIWDSRTRKLICGPIECPYNLESLLPVRGTRFAVIYGDKAEVRECDSGDRVGESFTFGPEFHSTPIAVSANGKHVIYMSQNGVNILDITGETVGSIPFLHLERGRRRSLDGKYMAWINDGEIKILDVDTENLLTGPSLGRPVQNIWLSDDSSHLITMSVDENMSWRYPEFLDIWDIPTKNMITKTIRYPFPEDTETLVFSKLRRLVVLTQSSRQHYVWDLDAYEIVTSTLYNAPPLLAIDADGSVIEGTSISSKTETLDYALMAWRKASLLAFNEVNDHGWVLGLQGELLFWVPPKMRQGFWFPCMTHRPFRNVTKLNFTNFVHGSDWTKCKS